MEPARYRPTLATVIDSILQVLHLQLLPVKTGNRILSILIRVLSVCHTQKVHNSHHASCIIVHHPHQPSSSSTIILIMHHPHHIHISFFSVTKVITFNLAKLCISANFLM